MVVGGGGGCWWWVCKPNTVELGPGLKSCEILIESLTEATGLWACLTNPSPRE